MSGFLNMRSSQKVLVFKEYIMIGILAHSYSA